MTQRLIVGVDGSESSRRAVEWAARECAMRDARLELVAVWEVSMGTLGFGYGLAVMPEEMTKELQANTEEILATAATQARAVAPDVVIETRAVEGQAADALVHESKDAAMLVVGSRGRGGFRELLLGSVSQQCAHHAACPVVIVHRERAA
jgi:nucleotide-binding universal stress UspA family protein